MDEQMNEWMNEWINELLIYFLFLQPAFICQAKALNETTSERHKYIWFFKQKQKLLEQQQRPWKQEDDEIDFQMKNI